MPKLDSTSNGGRNQGGDSLSWYQQSPHDQTSSQVSFTLPFGHQSINHTNISLILKKKKKQQNQANSDQLVYEMWYTKL